MMRPDSSIEAIALTTGKPLWSSRAAAKPLAFYGDRLLAEPEGLPLVVLDADDGTKRGSITLPMPPGVMPAISDSVGTTSSMSASPVAHDVVILWRYAQAPLSGVYPPRQPTREASGAFLVNLQTLVATEVPIDQARAKIAGSDPPVFDAARLKGAQSLYGPPQNAGQFVVGVRLDQSKSGTEAVFKRWRSASGEPMPDIPVQGRYAAAVVSPDRQHFLVVTIAAPSPNQPVIYTWSIYDIASGQLIARMPFTAWAPPFLVWNSLLVYASASFVYRSGNQRVEEPPQIHGYDLKAGKEVWSRALRDTTYRGPRPPRP